MCSPIQRLWVIWGECCPRVEAAPSLPNGPITQLSPYFTRKPGTVYALHYRQQFTKKLISRMVTYQMLDIFLPLLVRTSSEGWRTRDFPIQNGRCFRPGIPSPQGRPRGLPSGPTNSSRRRYRTRRVTKLSTYAFRLILFRDFLNYVN